MCVNRKREKISIIEQRMYIILKIVKNTTIFEHLLKSKENLKKKKYQN